ncbi:MAG: (d)CMP kinase [Bdellovibrionales bacterium]|nr:(d)CMP kinase [Oligoflexia bacterium]
MLNQFVVAVDGPAGTGKSSATKRIADLLGLIHVDTGALYRGVAYLSMEAGFNLELEESDHPAVIKIAEKAQFEFKRVQNRNPKNRLYVNGKDVTAQLRTPEMSMMASRISSIAGVRAALKDLQRALGMAAPSILEGRDIGTVIFPDAGVKFFLNASIDERAKRRLSELEAQDGDAPSFEELREQIRLRDEGDCNRAIAPLRKAEGAIEIDTTAHSLDEVVELMAVSIRHKKAEFEAKR